MHALSAFRFLWPQLNAQPGGGAKRWTEFQEQHPVNQEKIQAHARAVSCALAGKQICVIKLQAF